MNPLSLISQWLDIIYQVTTKYVTIPKPKLFRELNTALICLQNVPPRRCVYFNCAKQIWKNWALPKVRFFMWLASWSGISMADRRRRHGLDARDTCWLCDQEIETADDHLLISCASSLRKFGGTLSVGWAALAPSARLTKRCRIGGSWRGSCRTRR